MSARLVTNALIDKVKHTDCQKLGCSSSLHYPVHSLRIQLWTCSQSIFDIARMLSGRRRGARGSTFTIALLETAFSTFVFTEQYFTWSKKLWKGNESESCCGSLFCWESAQRGFFGERRESLVWKGGRGAVGSSLGTAQQQNDGDGSRMSNS